MTTTISLKNASSKLPEQPKIFRNATPEQIIAWVMKTDPKRKSSKVLQYIDAIFDVIRDRYDYRNPVILTDIIESGIPINWLQATMVFYWGDYPEISHLTNKVSCKGYVCW